MTRVHFFRFSGSAARIIFSSTLVSACSIVHLWEYIAMFAIFGLGPSEMICLAFLGVVVIVVVVLANRTGRTTPPPRPALDDPLRRIKRDYETLTERERRQLLQFVQDDLRREQPPDAPAAPPPESYTP